MSYVVVRVWVSRFKEMSPGHASLAIIPHARTPHRGYVSFAPVTQGCMYGPGHFYDFEHDQREYIRPKDDAPRGCWIGKIFGLNIHKMLTHFQQDQMRPQVYSLFNECATQVHKYLKIGGADRLASSWSRYSLVCWSPDDVEDYARSIVHHTRQLGSHGHKFIGAGTVF